MTVYRTRIDISTEYGDLEGLWEQFVYDTEFVPRDPETGHRHDRWEVVGMELVYVMFGDAKLYRDMAVKQFGAAEVARIEKYQSEARQEAIDMGEVRAAE